MDLKGQSVKRDVLRLPVVSRACHKDATFRRDPTDACRPMADVLLPSFRSPPPYETDPAARRDRRLGGRLWCICAARVRAAGSLDNLGAGRPNG